MPKEIHALKGLTNTGKSTTIRTVYELLLSEYPDAKVEHRRPRPPREIRVDVRAIITINGKKIGIESLGDPGNRLHESIKLFTKNKCDLIICATRTRGATYDTVAEQEPPYSVKWHPKEATKSKAKQEEANNKMAQEFLKIAVDLINS